MEKETDFGSGVDTIHEGEIALKRKLNVQNEVMKLFDFLPADFAPYQSNERPHDYEEKILRWTNELVEKGGKSRAAIFNDLYVQYSALDINLSELANKIASEMRSSM